MKPLEQLSKAQYDMLVRFPNDDMPLIIIEGTVRRTANSLVRAGYLEHHSYYDYTLSDAGKEYVTQFKKKVADKDYESMTDREIEAFFRSSYNIDADIRKGVLFSNKSESVRVHALDRLDRDALTDDEWARLAHDPSATIRIKAVKRAPVMEYQYENAAVVVDALIDTGRKIPRPVVEAWLESNPSVRIAAVAVTDEKDIDRLLDDPDDEVFRRTVFRFGDRLTRERIDRIMRRDNGREYLARYGCNLPDDIIRELMDEPPMKERLKGFRDIVRKENIFADKHGALIEEQCRIARESDE